MIETLRHREAFEYYYSLGGKTSDVSKVSVKCQLTVRTIWRWYKQFNWKEKIELRNIEISKKLEAKTDKTIVNTKADYRAEIKTQIGILKTILNKVIQDFKKNEIISVTTINELKEVVNSYEKLCRLDLLIMGEATQRDEVIVIRPKEENEKDSESGKSERNN